MKQKSLLKNSVYNLIKTFSGLMFPLISFTYVARILGEVGIGKVNFTKSIVSYFTMIAMLGMNYYGTREAAKRWDDKEKLNLFVREMLTINGCTTLLAYLLLAVAMLTVPKLQEYRELLLCSSLAILLQGMGVEWLYQAMEEYQYIAIRSVLFQVIALIALFCFVRDEQDVLPYAAITLFASSGSYVINFINARKYICFPCHGCLKIRQHLRPLLWLFAMAVSIELYTVLDSTMLGFLQGDGAVGRYTAAVKVNKIVVSIINAIGVVLIPRLSYYISCGEQEKIKELTKEAYNYVLLLAIPAMTGLFLFSNEIILLFSGNGFARAGITMRIMTPIVVFIPFSAATNQQTFVPMGKEKLILTSTMIGAITNFLCNLWLIPRYAENGAAIATVLAECAVAIVCFFNARRFFNMKEVLQKIWQYILAAISMVVIVLIVQQWNIQYVLRLCIAIVISAVSYLAVLIAVKNIYVWKIIERIIQKTIGRR